MSTFELYPEATHEAVKALYCALGKPKREEHPMQESYPDRLGECVHPVFGLAEHFRSHDGGNAGYTANGFRGDHITIPAYCEFGDVMAIEVSFHKGETLINLCTFPEEPKEVHDALYGLLVRLETR